LSAGSEVNLASSSNSAAVSKYSATLRMLSFVPWHQATHTLNEKPGGAPGRSQYG
jgi:hypothetical protein